MEPAAGLFDEKTFLHRVGRLDWGEASWAEVRGVAYDTPFPGANAIGIGRKTAVPPARATPGTPVSAARPAR